MAAWYLSTLIEHHVDQLAAGDFKSYHTDFLATSAVWVLVLRAAGNKDVQGAVEWPSTRV